MNGTTNRVLTDAKKLVRDLCELDIQTGDNAIAVDVDDLTRRIDELLCGRDATIAQQAAELKRINNVANCGTVDSWLSLSDEKKREWFAMTLHTDSEKAKTIKEQDYQLERQAEKLAAAEKDALMWRNLQSENCCVDFRKTPRGYEGSHDGVKWFPVPPLSNEGKS